MRQVLIYGLFASIGVWACSSDSGSSSGSTADGGTSSSSGATSSSGTPGEGGASSSSGTIPGSANAGKVDATFGDAGIAKMQPQSDLWAPSGGIVLKDGRVIIVGTGRDTIGHVDVVIGKLTIDGKPDAQDGANPSLKLVRTGSPNDIVPPVLTQEISDGALLFMGASQVASNPMQGFVEMLKLSDNTCTATFGVGFCMRTPNSTVDARPVAIGAAALDATGNVIVGGVGDVSAKDFVVQKLAAANGFPDNAFGDTVQGVGLAHTDLGGDEGVGLIDVGADGSIVATGVTTAAANPGVVMVKYTAAGAIDASFGTGGKAILGVPAERYAKTADGKIIVVAKAGGQTTFARILPTGTLDATFGNAGKATAAFTPKADANIAALAVLADGRLVVGYDDFTVGRFSASGALDASWNGNGFAVGGVPAGVSLHAVGVQAGDKIVAIGGRGKSGTTGGDADIAMFAVRFQN